MRAGVHVAAAAAVIAAAGWVALGAHADTGGDVPFVSVDSTSKVKAKHAWKTSGPGGDGKVNFLPFLVVRPGESGIELTGSLTVDAVDATEETVFLIVHAGKGSRLRPGRCRARVTAV